MSSTTYLESDLGEEVARLRARLEEAEAALRALRGAPPGGGPVSTGDLRESERLRGEVLAQIYDAVIAVDNNERITYLNAAAERQYRVYAGEVLGHKLEEIYHYRWLSKADEEMAVAALRETGHWRGEYVHILRNGAEFPVEASLSRLTARDGTPVGRLAVVRDISKRKSIESEMRMTSQRFELALRSSKVIVFNQDLDLRYTWIYNPTECFEVARVLGKGDRDLIERAEDAALLEALKREVIHTGVSRSQEVRIALQGVVRDYDLVIDPLRDSSGEIVGVTCAAVDITERKVVERERLNALDELKQADEALNAAHGRLQKVLSSITDGLLVLDRDWRYTYINDQGAGVLGMRPGDLLGRIVWEVFPYAVGSKFFSAYHRAVETGVPVEFEEFYPGPLNLWLECHCYPSEEGLFVYFRDITDRKRAEAALQQNAALFSALIEQAPMGMFVVDEQLRVEHVSAEARLILPGIDKVEGRELGEALELLWGPELARWCVGVFRHTLETGERFVADPFTTHRRDTGDEQAFEWETQRLILPGGAPGVVCYFRDITERVRADQALRASEERVRLATTATGVGVWEWNVLTHRICWDEQMFRLYGMAPTADLLLSYADWRAAVLPEDLPGQEEVLARTARHGGFSSREFRIRRRNDGMIRFIQAVETARTNADGQVEWVVGTNLDVTERRQAEIQLRDSEKRLALGIRAAGLALADIDYHAGMAHLTAEAARLYGLGNDPVTIPRSRLHEIFHPDDRERVEQLIAEAMDPRGPGWFAAEHRVVLPTGEIRWLRVGKQVVFAGDGARRRPVRATVAALDITAEKVGFEAVCASGELVRGVLDSLPEHVAVLDDSGRVTMVNEPWERFAYENGGNPGAVSVGVNYLDVCKRAAANGDLDAAKALQGLEDVLAGRAREFTAEYPCHAPHQERWFLMHAQRALHGPSGIVLSHIDISERMLAEQALKQADRRKDEFLATLAHELRNPLAPLRSGLEVMRLASDNPQALAQTRVIMERQLSQLVRLVDDLLDVSRITYGKLELRKERVDLAAVINSAVETSRNTIEEMGHLLEVTLPDPPVMLDADLTRLAQVFLNLLNNAAKYSEPGGHIWLTASQQGNEVAVSLRDTGIGIAPRQLPGIFELFSQLDHSLEKSQGGLGIGLMLVKRLVEMHGGSVEAKSAGIGMGSEFIVRLPVAEPVADEHPAPAAATHAATTGEAVRILVADDNVDAATTLTMVLERMGYQVAAAHNGLQAVESAAAFHPAVVLLDIGMPILNGYEACRRIRQVQHDAIIIALTGWGQLEDRQQSHQAGFDFHLVKPVDPPSLEKLLNEVLGKHPDVPGC
jgi:PAS domain S-box-containing protein